MQKLRLIRLIMILLALTPSTVNAQKHLLQLTTLIRTSSMSHLFSDPIIQSYDLSPDGRTVAILAVSGSQVGAHLWLVTEKVATGDVIASSEVGTSVFPSGGFAPQVLYSSDGYYLVVQDLRSIRVLNSSDLKMYRTICPRSGKEIQSPVFVIGARKKNLLACSFAADQKFNPKIHTTAVQIEIVDILTGEVLGSLASEDVPQAFSPNGDFIAISSSKPQEGLLPLNVFDIHGNMQASLSGGFHYKADDPSQVIGRVKGLFVAEQVMLLTPDDNIDSTGHHSGNELQLVTFNSNHYELGKAISPKHYGPTGELAVSADGNTMLAVSWYVRASLLTHEGRLPASTPELLVLGMSTHMLPGIVLPIKPLGFNVSGWMENRRPRVSIDGSVVAVAQDDGVAVFTRGISPK